MWFVTRQKRNMKMTVVKEFKQTCQIHDFIGYSENRHEFVFRWISTLKSAKIYRNTPL